MRDNRPSQTAGWVAAWRGMAPWLPEGAQLVSDPFGLEFAPGLGRPFVALTARWPDGARRILRRGPFAQMVLWLQLRTRALDDHLRAFLRAGGRQVVLLGAGVDCRASRLVDELTGATVFEIDHPATQARKREILAKLAAPSALTKYLAWNFEAHPMAELGKQLVVLGHDPGTPTLTIWEGVIPYLTEGAVAATVKAVRDWSRAPGSRLAFTYITRAGLARTGSWQHVVAALGEPWRFGWEPSELPAWMSSRGMKLELDEADGDLARRLFPPELKFRVAGRNVALASVVESR